MNNDILNIDSCRSFLNYLQFEKRYSAHTLTSYKTDIGQFLAYLKEIYELDDLERVSHIHIRSWMIHLVGEGVSPKSITRKLSALRSIFKFFKRMGMLSSNPMSKVNPPRLGKKLPDTLRKSHIEKLFDTIGIDDPFDFRNRLIIELFYLTGIRRSELIQIRDGDIDWSNQQVKVLGKGNKERIIPLSAGILNKIGQWQKMKTECFESEKTNQQLFLTDRGKPLYPKWVYNMVKRYLSSVTTQSKRSPHVLRHSFATHLMDEGADLNAVKELLGHANLSATQIYTHNSVEKLKAIYKTAHPKSGRKS